jgi:hypothetical protein
LLFFKKNNKIEKQFRIFPENELLIKNTVLTPSVCFRRMSTVFTAWVVRE